MASTVIDKALPVSRLMKPTRITAARAWFMVVCIVFPVFIIPMTQFKDTLQALLKISSGHVSAQAPNPAASEDIPGILTGSRLFQVNRELLQAMHRFEDGIEERSWLRKRITGPMRDIGLRWLRLGTEQVVVGKDNWLFFKPDISLLTGPGFMDPNHLRARTQGVEEWQVPPQPDPLKAILQFHRQLAERGIELILVPTPVKPMIEPGKLTAAFAEKNLPLTNPSTKGFFNRLQRKGLRVFDPATVLTEAKTETGKPQYLKSDTHWTPEAMSAAARNLADFIGQKTDFGGAAHVAYQLASEDVRTRGDLVGLLELPESVDLFAPEKHRIQQVLNPRGEPWRASRDAQILVLGDSFSNIYSFKAMGWGHAAGFAEHLSYHLGRPLDVIARNDDGAFATRQILSHDLAAGRDRLEGKKLVIWQFAARELAIGNWKLLDMAFEPGAETNFFAPQEGTEVTAVGVVEALSGVPKPGRVPYKDFIMSLHIRNLRVDGAAPAASKQAVVYTWGMRDNKWRPMASARAGQRVRLKLKPWSDVAEKFERFNRGELEDDALLLEPVSWAEEVTEINDKKK